MNFTLFLAKGVLLLLARPSLGQWDAHLINGQVIVHLFEWKWSDIASECEKFLGPKGYGGVQISPAGEHVIGLNEYVRRPWWERYQPVSYNIITRSGNEAELEDMVQRCNAVGIRIYADIVVNHMTADWPPGTTGTGGSTFNSFTQSYPGVPYSSLDFNDVNCRSPSGGIDDYWDLEQVRNCRLVGANDINQGNDYVRNQIITFMNRLIEIGVAGFRIDACKHMWPGDLDIIFKSLNDLSTKYFSANSRPFILQEVIDLGYEPVKADMYVGLGRVTEFKYGKFMSEALRGNNLLKWFGTFGENWGMLNRENAVVFIDNHDNQRGHGSGGDMVLTFRASKWYKMANGFMLAWQYGLPRVMSSYGWEQDFVNGIDQNGWIGPPHDENFNIISPQFGPDGACTNGWICEHRWRQIYNMVRFHNIVHGTNMNNWWDNGHNQIAFCRGNKGFFAMNNDDHDMKQVLQTCLSPGTYCDIISGSLRNGMCTGKSVTVDDDGTAYIEILHEDEDGILAIHGSSKTPRQRTSLCRSD